MKLLILLLAIAGACTAIPNYAKTTRPPAFPLAVRQPYVNLWLCANELPGNWPCFWNTRAKGWTGFIRVDAETYTYMGNPQKPAKEPMAMLATQVWSAITPTQTIFGLRAGNVDFNVTFFSPVEYDDIMRQSIPLSYVFVDVASNDGMAHDVQVYMDISGEWATGNDNDQIVTWATAETPSGLKMWTTERQTPRLFGEDAEYPTWGQGLIATSEGATYLSGEDLVVRQTFIDSGVLTDVTDTNFRCVSCMWPTFAFAHDLGSVQASAKVQFVVGHIREDNSNWLGTPQKALWIAYYPTLGELLDFFWTDVDVALAKADMLDVKILDDAFAAGGQDYADILTLSLRQSYAANEFSGTPEVPLYYQKEISSGAFMNTVDVIYPAAPMFYYLNVTFLRLLIEPLFIQMETEVWTKDFAMHDIGDNFPNALGQGYGGDMPVEESGNMIMMVGNIAFHPTADLFESIAYVNSHYDVMEKWANYLFENCLYPVNQLSTDDFIGPTELNSGLALKGILGMATFAKLSALVGKTENAAFYNNAVAEFIPIWIMESMHNSGTHLKMEYNVTDGYQFKYNAFHDKLLKLDVVPAEIYELEASFYETLLEPYGIPFVSTHDYTKSDWEVWTAAAFGDENPNLKTELLAAIARFQKFTPQRVPFTDWYVTATSNHVGFQARPVVGGHFAILALNLSRQP